jgi:hypothetical protein
VVVNRIEDAPMDNLKGILAGLLETFRANIDETLDFSKITV